MRTINDRQVLFLLKASDLPLFEDGHYEKVNGKAGVLLFAPNGSRYAIDVPMENVIAYESAFYSKVIKGAQSVLCLDAVVEMTELLEINLQLFALWLVEGGIGDFFEWRNNFAFTA